MNVQDLFIFQLVADIILCIAIVFLLYLMTRENRKRPDAAIDPNLLAEFQKAIDASQHSAAYLIKAMEDSRKALKEMAFALDERENRLRSVIARAEKLPQSRPEPDPVSETGDRRYADVLRMARQGLTTEEIVKVSGLARGEIDLIIELDLKKNESR